MGGGCICDNTTSNDNFTEKNALFQTIINGDDPLGHKLSITVIVNHSDPPTFVSKT